MLSFTKGLLINLSDWLYDLVITVFQAAMSTVQISTQFKINPLCHLAKEFRSDCGFTGISNRVREELDGMMETQALEILPVSFFLALIIEMRSEAAFNQ